MFHNYRFYFSLWLGGLVCCCVLIVGVENVGGACVYLFDLNTEFKASYQFTRIARVYKKKKSGNYHTYEVYYSKTCVPFMGDPKTSGA